MYNALKEIPQLKKLVQAGIRDYGSDEWDLLKNSNGRIVTYFDKTIRSRIYEGETWKLIAEEIVSNLPEKVFISFDIDGLDRKLCPFTGTPVPGGFELEQVFYLFSKILQSRKKLVGFDLNEVGIGGDTDWDANVGARVLYKLCNLLVTSNSQ
jgi:agmatinase